ncbi:MAG: hypothetical protein AMXMBFR33_61510 [Candidatus Xenobia bacterium]
MKTRHTIQTLILAVLLICAGNASPEDVTLLSSDNGKTIKVAPGTRITVRLESNPSTGYQWTLPTPPDPKVVKMLSSQHDAAADPGKDEEPVVGAPGTETWVYQATGVGTATVTMTYMRVFAPKDNPSDFSFTVVVE